MESADDLGVSEVPEISPEEGAAASVEAEMQPEGEEIASDTAGIDEGMQAADQLEELEEVVADTVEEGEGLPPVAAEAVRIALEAICARVGANPKSVYSLYATENFKSQSSRMANTKIALEGIGEFLKDLWKKIKAALTSIWQKAVDFFKKHFSSLGRIKKALESAKTKVSESSGKIKDKPYIDEAPSSLVDAFAGKADITKTVVSKFVTAHADATQTLKTLNTESDGFNLVVGTLLQTTPMTKEAINAAIEKVLKTGTDKTKQVTLGSASESLIGGKYITYTYTVDDEGGLTAEVERETVADIDAKLGLSISDKPGLQDIIKSTLAVITDTIKETEKFVSKGQPNTNKLLQAIEKAVEKGSSADENPIATENVKSLRVLMKSVYKYTGQQPVVNKEIVALNVRLAKSVLGYVSVCLKNFKSE